MNAPSIRFRFMRRLWSAQPSFLILGLFLSLALAAGPGAGGKTTLSATFVDMDNDKVGPKRQATPNGESDAHFRIVLDTGGATRVVDDIYISPSDAQGEPRAMEMWCSTPVFDFTPFAVVGVERNGVRLNPDDVRITHQVRGAVTYDLYANANEWMKPGQHFAITVKFDDGEEIRSVATMASPVTTARAGAELSAEQKRLVAEFGPPDSFVLAFLLEGEGATAAASRIETWQYHDLRTTFSFADGQFLGSEPLAKPPPRVVPQAFRPERFRDGMSWEEVHALVGQGDFATREAADLAPDVEELRGVRLVASRDALFGFGPGGLAYVQAVPADAPGGGRP
jgi:hypothetical protein